MPRHIINLRGTSGSGKSTLIRQLMAAPGPARPLGGAKILGYKCGDYLRVVGRYTNECGVCDGIKTQDKVCQRVREYALHGHVVFDGLLVSGIVGRHRALAQELGGVTFAFLDTPLDVCLERVRQRRAAKGNLCPLEPTLTAAKWERCRQAARQLPSVVWLPSENALPVAQDLLWARATPDHPAAQSAGSHGSGGSSIAVRRDESPSGVLGEERTPVT